MFRNFAAAVAALLMVGLSPAAQAQEVKVFYDFIFGYRHDGVDDEACFAEQADIFKKLKKQKRMFERPDFRAFKKQRRIVKRAVKAYRKACGEVTALVGYLEYDPKTIRPEPKPEPKPEPDPDPVDPAPDADDEGEGEVTTKIVVDMLLHNAAQSSICYAYLRSAENSFFIHQHLIEAARRGDRGAIDQVKDTYRLVVDWVDRFKDARCGIAELAIDRVTF